MLPLPDIPLSCILVSILAYEQRMCLGEMKVLLESGDEEANFLKQHALRSSSSPSTVKGA